MVYTVLIAHMNDNDMKYIKSKTALAQVIKDSYVNEYFTVWTNKQGNNERKNECNPCWPEKK